MQRNVVLHRALIRSIAEKGGTVVARQEGEDDSSTDPVSLKERDPSSKGDRRIQSAADWIAVRLPVISIAIIDEHSFTRECITSSLREFGDNLDIASFAACDDCLQSTRTHDLVLYHAHESVAYHRILYHTHESVAHHADDEEHLACLNKLLKIAPVIILSDVDCPESIVEAFERGARGYIPTASTTVELAIEIIRLVRAGGTFAPRSSLCLQETNPRGAALRSITIHRLTPRQREVLDRLKLGKANKIIAHELGVSESTVKVDIHDIMKKMKATNRTEVACRAYAIATDRGV
jgi:DNA-binding NarL/FixJ family response regulator